MTASSKKILWIDDDIQRLNAYVDALKNNGFELFTASNEKEALSSYKKNKPYIVLADIRMPPPNGIEILRRLYEINPNAIFAVLSSFLYLQRYRDEIAGLKFPVQLLDKDFPNIHDETFRDRFIKPIESLHEKGITYTVNSHNRLNENLSETNPFTIEFAEFMALNIKEKDTFADKAENMARKAINKEFSRGKIWVLFCGYHNEVAASAEDFSEIPSEDEILKVAHRLNRAPYQFTQHLQTEDHWTTCATNISLKDYPTISLIMDGHDIVSHFDTGCPFSLFSYEYLRENNIVGPASQFTKEIRNGFPPYRIALLKDIVAIIKSQKSGQTLKVIINGKAIREWMDSSYSRLCTEECARDTNHNPGDLCPLRRALIGRNILVDNKLSLVLDGENHLTYFGDE